MAATETTSFLKLRRRAEQGHDMAQYSLGVSYEIAEGVSQDNIEAVKWDQLATGQGNVDAQYNLGDIYARGDSVPENLVEAMKWLRVAAEQGHADAQFSLDVIREL